MALLELSQREGEWHNAMLSATASMVGRGWTDDRIYKTCAPYCWDGEGDADVEEMVEGARAKWNIPDGASAERLARLTRLEYDQQRKAAAKELGMRVSVLDRMVGAVREARPDGGRRRPDRGDQRRVCPGARRQQGGGDEVRGHRPGFACCRSAPSSSGSPTRLVMVGKEAVSLGDYWLGHPERRQYAGIEFAPPGSAARPGYYNLWQGFAVEPKAGRLLEVSGASEGQRRPRRRRRRICGSSAGGRRSCSSPASRWKRRWCCAARSAPARPRSGEVMGSLIGEHYLLVASPRYITGQFNSHMASLLVLHADEAFWAGDKASVGTLRDLVSGKHHMLEYKGVDQIRIKNHIRLFVTGNPDWMVPAGFRERRWAVFDMGEDHMQDHAYFAAIDHEMDNGGREALLHYLLNFDLSQVDLRTIPKTAALLDQQIESMTPEQAWWFETLMQGRAAAEAAWRQRAARLPEG